MFPVRFPQHMDLEPDKSGLKSVFPPLSSCVIFGKLVNLSKSQCPGGNYINPTGLL